MKREIPLIITFVTGLAMIAQFFIPHAPFDTLGDMFQSWFMIIASCAILLGVGNLIIVSFNKLSKGREVFYNVVLLVGLFGTAFVGLFMYNEVPEKAAAEGLTREQEFESFLGRYTDLKERLDKAVVKVRAKNLSGPDKEALETQIATLESIHSVLGSALPTDHSDPAVQDAKARFETMTSNMSVVVSSNKAPSKNWENKKFDYIYENIFEPMSSTMFSLLAFFIASAAFRAFRAKTFEAGLLLVSAFLVMLGRVPVGTAIWSRFPDIANWIMAVPNTAGQRAIMIGAALGVVSASLKILIGIERTYLGGGD